MYKESSLQRKYQKSIFIFRRDLRLKDNTALINALYSSNSVYCFFILDSNILVVKLIVFFFFFTNRSYFAFKTQAKKNTFAKILKRIIVGSSKTV